MRPHATWIARVLDGALLAVCFGTIAGLLIAVPATVIAWLAPNRIAELLQAQASRDHGIDLHHGGVPAFLFTTLLFGLGLVLVIARQLRSLARSVPAGTPFADENVRSLRYIAGAVAAGIVFDALAPLLANETFLKAAGQSGMSIDVVGIVAVLVLLVQAEIVAEGARLRRDAELTI